ncbi:MAG: chemotaxis protein CheA [Deltaproteobacteria bacterium]|nr:chemotaxis protein CheA [Deltaproteobacteria bacterium]
MSFPIDEMDDIINDFLAESGEALEQLDQKFIELEKNPGDLTLLNDIFRSVHTIKGAAGFLGFQQTVDVTHVTEDVLNKLRKSEMAVNPVIMDAILQSVDMIKVLLRNIKEKNNRVEDTSHVVAALANVLNGSAEMPAPQAPSAELKPQEQEAPRQAKPDETAGVKEKEQSIRVDIDRLDSVLNLAGELVLSRNRLMRLGSKLTESNSESELSSHLNEAISQLDLVTSDLQLAVMKMRMQPIAKVFNKFPRMVRDLARQTQKEIELAISGEETELDKTVIEEIGDPLVHLIRNSVDHGMETPEERVAKGKPRCGTVSLSAYQEGRHIIVSVADDGKGIDPNAIKKSAMEKGLISADEAEKMSNKEAFNLIFIPGFSTAKEVSSISGRGVGMDVVKTNITKINGSISIDSEIGKGTKIIFSLPLTLAIIQALTVETGGEIYGIPLATVIENIRVTPSEIKTIDGKEVISMRDHVYPVMRLGQLVSGCTNDTESEWKYIVIIGIGEKKFGLLVDRLHGQEEIVMKSMGEYLKGTVGIAGACINGDGNVILVLDMSGLLESLNKLCYC